MKTLNGQTYDELVKSKEYLEMDDDEFQFCLEVEYERLKPIVDNLRRNDVSDVAISAYLIDAYHEFEIIDAATMADWLLISDEDYKSGMDYYWWEMEEENPLTNGGVSYSIKFKCWDEETGTMPTKYYSVEKAIDGLKEVIDAWICYERHFTCNGNEYPVNKEQIAQWNDAIDNLTAYILKDGSEDTDANRVYLDGNELAEIGWVKYGEVVVA